MLDDDPRSEFARQLFNSYPGFKSTRALYLDFEGGGGFERILSLFWPQKPGPQRFGLLWRVLADQSLGLDNAGLERLLELFDCHRELLEWVVVFSGGPDRPDEMDRFERVFGGSYFPRATWINLHRVLRDCWRLKRAIREHSFVWFSGDQKRIRYSLEALEWEFGLRRPPNLRSHSNSYCDGTTGQMNILELEQKAFMGDASEDEVDAILAYCKWDVSSMFRIARQCEKLIDRPPAGPA